ncbi:MAG: DUF3108 domain-containing protein [Methyloligellaceae bacterium]
MFLKSCVRFSVIGSLGLVVGLNVALSSLAQAEQIDIRDNRISAKYLIHLSGIPIGKFFFKSNFQDRDYKLTGTVKLSAALKIILKWKGSTSATGTLTSRGPDPESFSYEFRARKKVRKVDLKFEPGTEQKFSVTPPLKTRKRVPVSADQVAGALDPLSGLILLSARRGNFPNRKVCDQNLPIFDGKERYDLKLSYKKSARIELVGKKTRFDGRAYVCSVEYVAISGHKRKDEMVKQLNQEKGIELWLVPEPKSEMYIPALIRIPTPYGVATVKTQIFRVDTPGQSRVSFLR